MKKILICLLLLSLLIVGMISCSKDKENLTDSESTAVENTLDSESVSGSESVSECESESESESTKKSESDIVFGEMTDDNQNWTPNY